MPNLRSALAQISRLKHLPRAGWVRRGVAQPESVAGHLHRMAILALISERPGLDRDKLVRMVLVHDLAESDPSVGDITPFDGVSKEEKARREGEAISKLCRDLPHGNALFALFQEYEDNATPEAKFAHQLDALEMGLQAREYEAAQGIDLSEFVVSAKKKISDPELLALLESE